MEGITIHHEIKVPENVTAKIPHEILADKVKDFLVKHNLSSDNGYFFKDNGFYWFLYSKGSRIDIPLNGWHHLPDA